MSTKKTKTIQQLPAKPRPDRPSRRANASPQYHSVDTSLLYEELRRKFKHSQLPVEVEFRTLVNWVRLGDQYTHQIHSYPAKLLPNIAHFFVRASSLVKPGSKVLDPFCGSGTVALEASLAGHVPLVADANPLSLLITAVKTKPFAIESLRATAETIVQRAAKYRSAPEIDIINPYLWYETKRKKDLEKLMRAIRELSNGEERDFFLLCFSTTARKLSLADPSISVPVRLRVKAKFSDTVNARIEKRLSAIATANVRTEFYKTCFSNIERVERSNNALLIRSPAIVVSTDARNLAHNGQQVETGSIPLIITSPPYGSAQKYIRASSLSLNWLQLAMPNELARLEGRSIGREHAPGAAHVASPDIPPAFVRLLETLKSINHLRYQITLQYLNDMRLALNEMSRVVMPGGAVVIVVGNNQVCGQALNNDEYCISILRSLGFELTLHLVDKIKSRGLLTKRKSTAPIISRESVLVFIKPGASS